MTDILERLELDIEGGSAEPWVLETCTLAVAEIRRLRGFLQSIRDERADVISNRESQMIAEIKRRGVEIKGLREARDLVMREIENIKVHMRDVIMVAWKNDAAELEKLRMEVQKNNQREHEQHQRILTLEIDLVKKKDEIERLRAVLILIVEDEEAFPIPPETRKVLLEALKETK